MVRGDSETCSVNCESQLRPIITAAIPPQSSDGAATRIMSRQKSRSISPSA